MPGDAKSFLLTQSGTEAAAIINAALARIWRDGWVLGAAAAWRLASPRASLAKSKARERPVTCDMGHDHDSHAAAGILLRSRNDNGKRVYFLHQRPDGDAGGGGTWVTPGGGLHAGEDPLAGAYRETQEEIGTLPRLRHHHAVVQDHGGWSYTTYIADVKKPFTPLMNGSTPDEVAGWGWFTKKEIRALRLSRGLDDGWDDIRRSSSDTVINSALGKAWRYRPLIPRVTSVPALRDPRQVAAARFSRAGIPVPVSLRLAGAMLAWLEGPALPVRRGIVTTLLDLMARVLEQQAAGKLTQAEAAVKLRGILGSGSRSARIAMTEISRAASAAAYEVYQAAGVTLASWVIAPDGACAICQGNAAAGPVPLGSPFPGGERMPPQHPGCRCAVMPASGRPGLTGR